MRAGISSFHLAADEQEVNDGINKLRIDIKSGQIEEVIRDYESNLGDYLFVVATKH